MVRALAGDSTMTRLFALAGFAGAFFRREPRAPVAAVPAACVFLPGAVFLESVRVACLEFVAGLAVFPVVVEGFAYTDLVTPLHDYIGADENPESESRSPSDRLWAGSWSTHGAGRASSI